MITNLKCIKNIGKFEDYSGNQCISKNQIIFGFNGSGKSTISDIFYSLANNQSIDQNRKTLDKDNGQKSGDMRVEIETENGIIVYDESGLWNKDEKIHIFNSQYIKKNVLVEGNVSIFDTANITFGKNAIDLKKRQTKLISEKNENFDLINRFINSNKKIMGDLGLPKTKLKRETSKVEDKLTLISNIKLYPLSNETIERNRLKTIFADSKDLEIISSIESKINQIIIQDLMIDITLIKNILKSPPNITQKELNSHMSKYMKVNNMNWLIEGVSNQSDEASCPFCGQELKTKYSQKLIKNINKYILNMTNEKAKVIQTNVDEFINSYNVNRIIKI